MKKMILVLCTLLWSVSLLANGKNISGINIQTSPLSIVFDLGINLEIEKNIKNNYSVSLLGSSYNIDISRYNFRSKKIGLGGRHYFTSNISDSSFIKADILYIKGNQENKRTDEKVNFKGLNYEFMGGYKWIWNSGVTMSLSAGIGHLTVNKNFIETGSNNEYYLAGEYLIGYRF